MIVGSEQEKSRAKQQEFLLGKLEPTPGQQFLQQIIDNSYDSIFVTDKYGNVLLANSGTGVFMGYTTEELIGKNVENLVKKGAYDWSPTMKAIKTRTVVSGIVRNKHGIQEMATSKPLLDEKGEIVMVITNARDKDLVEEYIAALEKERSIVHRYKTAVEYLSEVDSGNKEIVAESPQMKQIIKTSNVIAKTDSTVMLIGETGTGKEVMARHIHRNSYRSKEPFIPVNCAAIPHDLLESEFFGYVRGAFSGANPQGKPGLFEIADKGTLFLDELAELPLSMQSKLLRVLESSEIKRLGDTNIHNINVRFIAATNRDLKTMINQKQFRSDLYYRLNVIPINLPALKDRPEDILAFAHKFLEELNKKYSLKKQFSTQATQLLFNYNWPGNVRELRNVIERLVITSSSDILNFDEDSLVNRKPSLKNEQRCQQISRDYQGTLKNVIKSVEEEYINQVLAECGGRIREAAQRLGIHRTMLYRKLKDNK
ncbi:sigma-54 interaction domain-containing protein [Desulfosporosinus meridiei]|uniref:PAS domain S-box n=1 Tax=Desulfosporosinus meridiei (strain ATCC BAA-275 / DSM 13257 / KCTC 12902 / NCIMB 13706 / S10) TaxID=768704 RepID=J7IPC4_DESMD|nr:sigma-54-dependent Fis family transcriptional regulator [Desulfosporosinus meridiei]AFQ43692.1 PAS domain S-box [Desulfosporosinus meridiei DSM 13257]